MADTIVAAAFPIHKDTADTAASKLAGFVKRKKMKMKAKKDSKGGGNSDLVLKRLRARGSSNNLHATASEDEGYQSAGSQYSETAETKESLPSLREPSFEAQPSMEGQTEVTSFEGAGGNAST